MARVPVVAKTDFIQSIATSSRPLPALAEIIWNGFDSGSEEVEVFLKKDDFDGIELITIKDFGSGIDFNKVDDLFGNLGDSWKKQKGKLNGRSLHGKNGRGRFKAFSLGSQVEWSSVYNSNGTPTTFSIKGRLNSLANFELTDPLACPKNTQTGTQVTIGNIQKNFKSLQDDSVFQELAKIFAAYLTEYPDLTLKYNGKNIDPKSVQSDRVEYQIDDVILENGTVVRSSVSIIEWKIQTERSVHLCDDFGVTLHEVASAKRIKAPGFYFTTYIKSNYFKELDSVNLLCLSDLNSNVQIILDAATSKVKSHFRKKLSDQQSGIIQNWKKLDIYPYDDKSDIGPIEIVERQVFDILAVNIQSYLPSFKDSDITSKRFTFSLLAQAVKQNPESVQLIISEVLGLNKETQDELAKLLKKTSLSSIIQSSKVVANRIDFLNALETLLFDPGSKKKLLERDQLHKILEREAWIFNEEFTLAGSEQRLEEVLQKYLAELGQREETVDIVDLGDGKTGRVDLMLHKAVTPRNGEFDYLIVELKRPSQKINSEVLTQIEKYAIAVANDERFHGIKVRWNFIAVSNELDAYARKKARQKDKPIGLVYEDGEQNITVWARSWSEIISDARTKLNFINAQLQYKADHESALDYLQSTHAKFIPDVPIFQKASDSDLQDVMENPENSYT